MAGLIKLIADVWEYFVQNFAAELVRIVRNPRADLIKTGVVLGIVIAAVLLVVFIVATLLSMYNRDREEIEIIVEEEEELPELQTNQALEKAEWLKKIKRRGAGRVMSWIMFFTIIGVLVGSIDWFSSQPALCANCHIMQEAYSSWKKAGHKKVGCLGCHQAPGLTGYGIRRLDYVRETISFFRSYSGEPQTQINNHSCLKCHREEMSKVITKFNIKVRHKDFLGDSCSSCHSSVGHGESAKLQTVSTMTKCLMCHDNDQASARCSVCHAEDIGVKMRVDKRLGVKKMMAGLDNCRGCHSTDKCTEHHGTEMPHQQPRWRGAHGRIAGSTNDPICWRCHPTDYSFCKRCHGAIAPHPDNWEDIHKLVVRGQREFALRQCTRCHELGYCLGCHEPDGNSAPSVPDLKELLDRQWPVPVT